MEERVCIGLIFMLSRIIYSIIFVLFVTPVSIIARVLGARFLEKKFDKSRESYWHYYPARSFKKKDYEGQF